MISPPESEAVLTGGVSAAQAPAADTVQAPAADTAVLESILAPEDARAYRRFLEWSIGGGFKLAIVEVTAPRDRDALVAWTASAAPGARAVTLDEAKQRPVWALLEEACQAPGETDALVLTRLEELHDRSKVCAQLNIQRDELARAFAVPWVVLVHPSAALDLQRHAPDFCDFASLWMRARPGDPATPPALREMPGVARSSDHLASAPVREASEDDLLDRANDALLYGLVNEARDLLAEYDLQHPDARARYPWRIWLEAEQLRQRGEPALAMAQLQAALPLCAEPQAPRVHGAVLFTMGRIRESWGELDEAANLYRQALQLYDQRGDQLGRAASLSAIADILHAKGELDEAFRIQQHEVLPAFEKLGDVRSHAVTLNEIANILEARGELDEALRIRQQEVLPVFEKLGDVRSRALILARIAGILGQRGEANEELRLMQGEVLPVIEKLGDVRVLVSVRRRLALAYLDRDRPGDREVAAQLLELALEGAERLRLPEAAQIRAIQQSYGLAPAS